MDLLFYQERFSSLDFFQLWTISPHRQYNSNQDMNTIVRVLRIAAVAVIAVFLLGGAVLAPMGTTERVWHFTYPVEFDFTSWTLRALAVKSSQAASGLAARMPETDQSRMVRAVIELQRAIILNEDQIEQIYANPDVKDPATASAAARDELRKLQAQLAVAGPVSESVLQDQVSAILETLGLTLAGQPIPPVLYHVTPLPYALIVSPRDAIRQDANISLIADLNLDQMVELEQAVENGLGVSALVVPVGGIGVYPTMVMRTTHLPYLAEVVAHEWTHNYLTLRPLGFNYDTSPELRTMNETAASISGVEVSELVMKRFYPELVPPPTPAPSASQGTTPRPAEEPPVFNYRAEMHETRVTVDQLLKEGKIEQAEAYMEARRRVFWDNGYQIRRLNQAYFAFYGAYADQPGGAAGEDPVGPAVRALRAQSDSLAGFLNRIAWMTSFDQLRRAVQESQP